MKILFGLLICLTLGATLNAQSLADLARQERERKKGREAKVTFTNDSIKPAAVTGTPTTPKSATTNGAAPAASAAPAGPVDRQGRDEKFWRAAFADVRQNLSRAETQIKVLDLRMNQARQDLLTKTDLFNREQVLGAEITLIQKEIDTAKADAERFKQQLVTMEDDLRRSGGPAGWAR